MLFRSSLTNCGNWFPSGAASEGNQLPQLVSEYAAYRTEKELWKEQILAYTYRQGSDTKYVSFLDAKEVRTL